MEAAFYCFSLFEKGSGALERVEWREKGARWTGNGLGRYELGKDEPSDTETSET